MAVTTEESKRAKQTRAKARRKVQRRDAALKELYKPIEEWDNEELARGRPRDHEGKFRGRPPGWVSRSIHEEAVRRFTEVSQSDMRALVPTAIATVRILLYNDEVDEKGKLVVPPSVKLQAAQWVVEHLVGKPTQRIEQDISVRLQGILATALVQPGQDGMIPAIDVESWVQDEDEDQAEE